MPLLGEIAVLRGTVELPHLGRQASAPVRACSCTTGYDYDSVKCRVGGPARLDALRRASD